MFKLLFSFTYFKWLEISSRFGRLFNAYPFLEDLIIIKK